MAYKTISNMGGIEIMLSNSGDAVIYRRYGKLARGLAGSKIYQFRQSLFYGKQNKAVSG